MANEPTQPSLSDLLSKDLDERAKNCKALIDKALLDFNCSINAAIVVRQSGNSSIVEITANPPKA